MKVLQINSVCGTGSTGRMAADIHHILTEQGHESCIAYGRDAPKNCDHAIRIGNRLDNYKHAAWTRIFDKHGFGSKRATEEFIKKIKKMDPDVIHLHNIHGYYININILFDYIKEAEKPVVWTFHDCWNFTGHCSYFDDIGCEKWMAGCHHCPAKKAYPRSMVFDCSKSNYTMKKNTFSGVDNLIIATPSQWMADLVRKSCLKEYPLKVIHNGINLEVFKPTKGNFRKKNNLVDQFIILGVANRWAPRKGLQYFIELAKQCADDEAIVLVGLSENQLKEIPQNIIGISRTDNMEELADIYSGADVFVNPTLDEALGMTNIEALACGTPVITFDTGGSPETVSPETGLVIKKGDLNSLIQAIKHMKHAKPRADICTKRAEQFRNRDRFAEYIELYKAIM
jgi:putative colanic acid biosynthesis glycosyltransferase